MQRRVLLAAIAGFVTSVLVPVSAGAGELGPRNVLKRHQQPGYQWISNGYRARSEANAPVILMLGIGY
jgi:hypothetical protein